ncbi:fatty acid desaturase family protein [Actinomadura parmotrematis]|uniref:Fatty acid desaturase n=1 Tax=Actinomadura parmotrematis TaxID=2864039 RepID=A0ABS7G275_9ACTN|nr:fatty acid desaturase [Actinomadura parmotrematis]MBW8486809.1 fatty acid desaturase [Actinomadura parmotrematis]
MDATGTPAGTHAGTRATTRATGIFQRVRVRRRDRAVFIAKLAAALALLAAGAALEFLGGTAGAVAGVVLLAAVYTHMVELQHQCLHHSAFTGARPHRLVGVPLGLPLLVSYSHYRVRHLQHHRYLGTERDSEFFGFDAAEPLTWRRLLRGAFDYRRLLTVVRDVVRSTRGTWSYDLGQISDRRRREVIAEYRLIGAVLAAAVVLAALGQGEAVLRLWLLPLAVAVPMHFLLELPEHVLCDTATTDVLRNTRSITGSRFSTWFTNGNNLHVEHHAAMTVAINRLRERHPEVRASAKYVERGYPTFYWRVARAATAGSRARASAGTPGRRP